VDNLLERWVRLLAPFGFSERFVRWSFMCGVSAMLENRCWMYDYGGGFVYPTLYVLLIGAPATFKTSTCDRMFYDLLGPIASPTEGPFFGPSIATPQQMVHIFRRNNQMNQLNNFKSSPMFVYTPEFNTFYRDIGGGEMTVDLLNFYDPKPPGAIWTKETVKDGRLEVISPALTILGCTTQKNVIDSRMMSAAGTGIVSRFVLVYEPNRPEGCFDRPDIRESKELRYIQAAAQALRAMRGEFKLSSGGEATMQKFAKLERQWHRENVTDTLFASYMARRGTQLRKLAMLFSAMSRKSMVIEAEDIIGANAMLEAIEGDMPMAYGAQIIRNDPGLVQKLMGRIPTKGIRQADLMQAFTADGQALTVGRELQEAIQSLISSEEIITEMRNGEHFFIKRQK
jgi:hypothetical protein